MNNIVVVVVLAACVICVRADSVFLTRGVLECPTPDPSSGTYFSDPDDCRYFYLCSNGESMYMMCDPGTVFISTSNTCDYKSDMSGIPRSNTDDVANPSASGRKLMSYPDLTRTNNEEGTAGTGTLGQLWEFIVKQARHVAESIKELKELLK